MKAIIITLLVILGMAIGEKVIDWIAELSANPVCLVIILSVACISAIFFVREIGGER